MSSPLDSTSFDFFKTQGYKNGLFGCFADLPVCLAVSCCGPNLVIGYAMGQIKGNTFDIGSCCCSGIAAYRLRKHVQNTYGIKETDDAAMCAISCCGCCTTIQDVAELRARGALGAGVKTVQPTGAQMEAPQ